jgi:ribosomal protein S18 acetylase RimI-like enzyme/predicted NBD/HSP70 family sugar kinase
VWDKILNVITNQFFINVVSDTEVNQIVHYTGIWLLIFLFRSNLPKDKLEVGLSVLEEILNTMSRQPYSKIYLGASESGKEISKFTWAGMAYKVAEGLIEEALQQETPVDFDKMRRKLYRRTKREAEKLLSAAAAGEPARAGGKETIPTYEVGITVARGSALGAGEANLAGEVQFVPLTKEFVQGHYEELMDAEQSPQMEREGYWDQARFLEDMRASTKTLLEGKWELSEAAVDENGRVIGYLIGIYGNDDCPFAKGGLFVFRLAVHRDHRRRHIASVLLHRFAQKALESGISKVSLETWQENKAAQEVYENAGFKKIGERYDGKKGMNFYQYTADAQALFDAASSSVLPPAKANLAGEASASADAKGFGQHISLEAREAIWRRTGYRIVRWLGFGSESIFYEVVDSAGGHFALGINYERRNVYAEKIKKQLADDRHPAIPAIYKTGRLTGIRYDLTKDNFVISGDSSLTYQVYELRRGVSLDKFPKKKLTPEIAAAIISGTIEGLDFLFRHGFSHPDFVEDNIVVEISADGQIRVYLSDFVPNGPRDLQVGIGKNILSWRRISNSVLVSSRLSKELRRQARPIIDRIKKLFLEWDEDSMAKAKPDLVALRHIISASAAGASANLAGEGNQAASVRGEMLDSLKDNYWISYWHSVFRKLAESDPENTITAVITFDRGAGQSKEFRIAIPDPAILNNVTQKKYIFRYLSVYINNRAVSWGTENIGVEFEGTDFGEEYFGLLYDELSNSGILRQINETANYGRSVIIKHGHVQSSRLQPQQKAASTAAYDFSKGRTIGVDIGGTNIKIGTLDKGRFAPYGKPVPTQLGQAPEIIVGQAVELIKQAIGEGSVDAVCVASPSLVTEEGEIVKCSLFEEAGKWSDEQKRYWQGLREHMEKALGVPVVVVEDGYSAICSVLYGKAVENYKDIGYVGGGKGLTARVLKSGGNYEIPLSECGRVIVDLSPLAPAHTSTGVTGVAQQIFSSQAMYRFLKNRGIKIPEYSAYDPDLLQIGTFIDNELIEGNESVIAAINDMTGGLGFVLLELSDIFENYTWILGGGVVSGQTGQLLGHFLRKNPLLYHITTIFNISADVEPGYVGTFGATHIANRFAQIQAASANLAGDLSAEAHTSYDEYRAKAEARAEGAQDVTEEAKEILTVALDDDSPALASLLSIMERLGVRVIEGTIPREVAQGARWADGEIGRAEIISDVKMEQGYPVRIDSATIYCGSRLSSLELMHELVEFEFVEMLMQDNQRGNHLSAENIQQLINLRLNDLMVWLHLICRWRYYKLGHRAIFICAKGAYREGEKIFANAGDRAGQIMDILKKTSFAAEVLTYLEDFDAIVTECEPVLKAMSENLPIDQVEVKHYILSAVVEFLDKINALAVADPSWFLSDGRHRGEAGVGRLLLGAVELRHNIHALAAVVIDEKAAADEKRKDMEEQIKMRWGFDAVAIVADGAAAEQKKQELEGKYPGIRFLRIQRLDEGFAFGIIDMAGLDMIKLQAQINEAIREYLKSV